MMLKIIGSVMIIAASAFAGQVLAMGYKLRPQHLREMQLLLQMLENEIGYLSTVLPDAFRNIAVGSSSAPGTIFTGMAENLRKSGADAASAWNDAVSGNIGRTALTKEDGVILCNFGRMLGGSDRENQIGNIRLTVAQLRIQEQKAEDSRKKNETMYKSLGLLCGAAVIVIMI